METHPKADVPWLRLPRWSRPPGPPAQRAAAATPEAAAAATDKKAPDPAPGVGRVVDRKKRPAQLRQHFQDSPRRRQAAAADLGLTGAILEGSK